ncbi:hypothetical protein SAMN04488245_102359 [Alloyangia pacifica]|uniref:Uncharacterized protein n=2 Tax=Alloyangia pacifica TaxID=311180 RepID=A0A1I6PNB3_9RHOB|nr:hypothetical protein SAMN04488245_102359 [Alloyangia pacifica]SFS41674.1 hypothetical protein SAMN04488050_101660 [Alloyangia pacifica]
MCILRLAGEIGMLPRQLAQSITWREMLGFAAFWERQARQADGQSGNIMAMDGGAMATALTGGP